MCTISPQSSVHTQTMILLSLSLILTAVTAFPWPQECGINYIEPDNVGNATNKEMITSLQSLTSQKEIL